MEKRLQQDFSEIPLSIVITTYNRSVLLERCLASVYAQNYSNFEVLVLDDHSIPCYKEAILNKYPAVNYIYQEENTGPGPLRNRGIEASKNNFVVIMDDDDVFLPGAFEKIAEFFHTLKGEFKHPVYNFLRSNASVMQETYCHTYSFKELIAGSVKGDLVHVFNKSYPLQEMGYQYPQLKIGAESLLWNEIAINEGFPVVNEVIVKLLEDADDRLTNFTQQLRKSKEFADYQISIIDQFKEEIIKVGDIPFLVKKYLGAVTYLLLSGEKTRALIMWKELIKHAPKYIAIFPLFLVPKKTLVHLFLKYRSL